ncbi:MAG: HAD hydrolase-like protein [Nocardioides sp.]
MRVAPASAVMIGDSSWDREAARAAGTAFVGVPTDPSGLPAGTVVCADLAEAVRRALAG